MRECLVIVGAAIFVCAWSRANAQIAVQNQGYIPFSDAPIYYRTAPLTDPVAKLERRLEEGKASLVYHSDHGYLRSVLKWLDVPIDSQTLVFSKTSFQYRRISPEHPRALYFNDEVYVGSVHDGKAIEVVSFDPRQGAIFYLLDEHQAARPRFQRAELDCTQCHIAAGTRGIPGVLLRSVYPTATGTLLAGSHSFITDQESPIGERWGGWYVTGLAGGASNMGNAVVDEAGAPGRSGASQPEAVQAVPIKLVAVSRGFDPSAYLAPGSDVVGLLVLAHQTQMHNLITLTNYRTRLALYSLAKGRGDPASADAVLPGSVQGQFQRPAEQLLRYLLFSNEASLVGAGTEGLSTASAFARDFAARGPRDAKGRSLRDFDLRTRLFRYPCSYLIYSEDFEALPEPAKSYIYHRLLEILSGEDRSPDFAKLSDEDRRAILEILLATKTGLPEEWSRYASSHHIAIAAVSPRLHASG
jgi:hypothetical protein